MSRSNPIKRLYDLYVSDLSYKEIERLIKQESSDVYQYFAKDLPKNEGNKNKFVSSLLFVRNLFNAFLMKLNPARRFFYLIAVIVFAVGMIEFNKNYLFLSFLVINFLLIYELFDKLTLIDEISIAKNIQKRLIPQETNTDENYEIASYYEGAREVSGDYYDFIKKDDKTYLIIGDISGKGIPAALYMIRVQAILQTLVKNCTNLKQLMCDLKSIFMEKLEPGYFLTIIISEIFNDGKISISRAGHNPALFYKKKENAFEVLDTKGMGIGFKDNGMFDKVLEVREIGPEQGDILFFYTDGASESMNIHKTQFGIEHIQNIIKYYADKPAGEILNIVKNSIHQFRDENMVQDDMTMIILKRK